MSERKRWQHDCDGCLYLGQDEKHDFYYCARCDDGSVIARYGDQPWEYASSMVCLVWQVLKHGRIIFETGEHVPGTDPRIYEKWPLAKALTLGVDQGVIPT
jgi:hypothetical protein